MLPTLSVISKPSCCYRFPIRIAFILFLLIPFSHLYSQQQFEKRLIQNLKQAKSDSEQIGILGKLSEYYYANKDFDTGDSLIEKQIMLAEATLKQHLVLMAYFNNAGLLTTGAGTKERLKTTGAFIKRGLEYAKANELEEYIAYANANLAHINSSDGQLEQAFKFANLAFTTALNTNSDSAKVVAALQLGNIYQQRSDVLMAFKTFTNAQNIAIHHSTESLLPMVYHQMGILYDKLKKTETAKKYINQSLAINKRLKNIEGQILDNIFLAKLNNYVAGKAYLQEAIMLADSIYNPLLKIEGERILFFHMLIAEKPAYMIDFLEKNPELKNVFIKTGPGYINWMLAEIHLYSGGADSALYYFKIAEPFFEMKYDLWIRKNFFDEYADAFKTNKNVSEAITYYNKSFLLYKESSDLRGLKSMSSELKDLYQQQGDYKQAFTYSLLYENYKDSVDLLGRERDLALMEIENVARQQQREEDLAKEKQRRKFNLQYMLITIVVATAFVVMIIFGMFKVSALTIRLMGFLSLIFFFEFVILILDNWIHHLTHGEPWKIWLIKIGLISILLPMHHFLEHRLIHYLLSRHLITVRSRLSLSRLFGKKKKPLSLVEGEEEVSIDEKID